MQMVMMFDKNISLEDIEKITVKISAVRSQANIT